MDVKKKKLGFKLILISMLLLPMLVVLFIVGCNSKYIVRMPFFILICILIPVFIILFIYGLMLFTKNKHASKRKLRKWLKVFLSIFMTLYIVGCGVGTFLLYGPYDYLRNLYVTTAMKTMHHQHFAKFFYSDETIQDIMSKNYFIEFTEDANTDDINIDTGKKKKFKDEYEEELLTRDEDNDLYKLIELKVGGSNAYLVAIYDPTKVRLITTKKFNIGTTGERIITMCERYGGVVCINAGGFQDNGWGSDIPIGYVIQDGEITWTDGDPDTDRQNIIGLTKDGKLKLMTGATGNEALEAGVVDGLVFGPFLILNGKALDIVGDPWGKAPRVAIAQREDGVMMFLVVDGENYINGASLKDMIEVLQRYGAYNAANLDGGQSSSLVIENKLYNTPPPAAKAQNGRYVVTGFGLIP